MDPIDTPLLTFIHLLTVQTSLHHVALYASRVSHRGQFMLFDLHENKLFGRTLLSLCFVVIVYLWVLNYIIAYRLHFHGHLAALPFLKVGDQRRPHRPHQAFLSCAQSCYNLQQSNASLVNHEFYSR